MKRIALAVTRLLLEGEIISAEEQEVYVYGLQLILSTGMTTLVILGMGCLLHQLLLTIIFIAALRGLRHYLGGFHASSYLKCFLVSCLCYGGMLGTVCGARWILPAYMAVMMSWLLSLFIIYQGSVNSCRMPKTSGEMKKRKQMTRMITSLYTLTATILYGMGSSWLWLIWLLFYVQLAAALGAAAAIITQRRCLGYEEGVIEGNCKSNKEGCQ